jgi:WD40 repeat protein
MRKRYGKFGLRRCNLTSTLQGHTDWVSAVAVTPDGRQVVSGSWDHTLRVWDLKDEKEILTFTIDGNVTRHLPTPCALNASGAEQFV